MPAQTVLSLLEQIDAKVNALEQQHGVDLVALSNQVTALAQSVTALTQLTSDIQMQLLHVQETLGQASG